MQDGLKLIPLTEQDIEKMCKRKPREQEILIAGMLIKITSFRFIKKLCNL